MKRRKRELEEGWKRKHKTLVDGCLRLSITWM